MSQEAADKLYSYLRVGIAISSIVGGLLAVREETRRDISAIHRDLQGIRMERCTEGERTMRDCWEEIMGVTDPLEISE